MPATKSAKSTRKNAKPVAAAKSTRKPAAKPAPTPEVAAHVSRNEQGRLIQAAMSASLMTIEQLAEKNGFSVARVKEHVDYEVSKGRSKLNGKKQVVVLSQPIRRSVG